MNLWIKECRDRQRTEGLKNKHERGLRFANAAVPLSPAETDGTEKGEAPKIDVKRPDSIRRYVAYLRGDTGYDPFLVVEVTGCTDGITAFHIENRMAAWPNRRDSAGRSKSGDHRVFIVHFGDNKVVDRIDFGKVTRIAPDWVTVAADPTYRTRGTGIGPNEK